MSSASMPAPDSGPQPSTLWWSELAVLALVLSGAVLVFAGTGFVHIVGRLADRTGIGEAPAGAVLLGATTSLPGLIVTSVAAWNGEAVR